MFWSPGHCRRSARRSPISINRAAVAVESRSATVGSVGQAWTATWVGPGRLHEWGVNGYMSEVWTATGVRSGSRRREGGARCQAPVRGSPARRRAADGYGCVALGPDRSARLGRTGVTVRGRTASGGGAAGAVCGAGGRAISVCAGGVYGAAAASVNACFRVPVPSGPESVCRGRGERLRSEARPGEKFCSSVCRSGRWRRERRMRKRLTGLRKPAEHFTVAGMQPVREASSAPPAGPRPGCAPRGVDP
ncbi:hypothetical protein MBT84_45600 [Streptomyces sp. MBT84]|nr:hypothetical protein [Streptomyces sp. MBT84]